MRRKHCQGLKECHLEEVSRLHTAKTGVVCDGFHPKIPWDLTKETRGEFPEKVEQSGKWPQQACTAMFFLIPESVTSERPIALMPTLIRWWAALRAPDVAKWQQKYRVDLDPTDGRNGGAQQTVLEILMEMERFYGKVKKKRIKELQPWFWIWRRHLSGSVFVWCGLGQRTSASQGRSCECCAGTSSTRGVYSSKDVRQSRSRPSRLSCQGSKWICLLFRIVLQDALNKVTNIYPPLKLRVFVDNITAPLREKKNVVAEMAKKVMKKLKEEVERKGLKLAVTEDGKEGTSKMIASCGFLENELRQFRREGVTMADSVDTLSVDLRTRVNKLGAKDEARRKKCRVTFSLTKKNKAFQTGYVKVGVKNLLRAGMMPARTWGVHAVGMALTERLKLMRQMAAAALSLFTKAYGLEVQEELYTLATQYWTEGVWTGKFKKFRCGDR